LTTPRRRKSRRRDRSLARYYREENANVHRGVHALSAEATDAYDAARERVRRFLNVPAEAREVIFVRGATEAINLVAATFGRAHVQAGDEIVVSEMEHHSKSCRGRCSARRKSARLRVIPITGRGRAPAREYERLLGARTESCGHARSNALGTIQPGRPDRPARARPGDRCAD